DPRRAREDIDDAPGLRLRAALSAAARTGDAGRVGVVAPCEDARMGSADRHSVGRPASRALQRGAAARRADVLEPAYVGRVRRDLRESGAAAALLPRAAAAGSAVLFHHADDGGRATRRSLMANGRAAGTLLPAAAEPADGRRRRHTRRPPHGV